MRYQTLNHLW
jgi:hypothetical protein